MAVQNVVLISLDGVRKARLEELLSTGNTPNIKNLLSSGSYYSPVYLYPFLVDKDSVLTITNPQDIKLDDINYHEEAVTDSGHAKMLTGRNSPDIEMCIQSDNKMRDFLCNNNYNTIPIGETIMEILKQNTNMAVGVCSGRRADYRDFSDIPGYGRFFGFGTDDIWTVNGVIDRIGGHGFFSTTFLNSIPSFDYFFDSSKVSEYTESDSWWNFYTTNSTYIVGRELKATYVALKSNEFISNSIAADKNFFLFVHFCEPDLFGHIYGEGSPEYSQAIIECDKGIGLIVNNLISLNKYNNTLLIITTDHGAEPNSSPATFQIINGKKFLVKAGPLHGQVDIENHVVWMINNQINITSPINQIDIVPFILSSQNLFGGLHITSNPDGAKVYINNKPKGQTPLTINNMPIGIKKVELQVNGYNSVIQKVSISKGTVSDIYIDMINLNIIPYLVVLGIV